MPQHPSATVRQAREALAARLRDLRLDAGISGRELAARCAWSESKTSRIENARTQPSDADIRRWCVACRAADRSADLVAANRQSTEANVEWRGFNAPVCETFRRPARHCTNVPSDSVCTAPTWCLAFYRRRITRTRCSLPSRPSGAPGTTWRKPSRRG
ncbi:helix-turn-helix domain-containing protein [Streptomyces sp. NPDC087420]|uniref:helix-turn-helix domain-containing protein n=1 Tax=Streptomyces sp. NPDC087420 TaxID=3365785 RepID=UPI003834C8A3